MQASTKKGILIVDREDIIAASGDIKKQYLNRRVSRPLSDMIESRISKIAEGKEVLEIVDGETTERSFVMIPIISNGDSLGAVILVGTEEDELINELDVNSVKIATSFLGKYSKDNYKKRYLITNMWISIFFY